MPSLTSHLRGWSLVSRLRPAAEDAYWGTVLTLGNGLLGVRGTREEAGPGAGGGPLALMAEVYDRPARQPGEPAKYRRPARLVPLPHPFGVELRDGGEPVAGPGLAPVEETRRLDLRTGILHRVAVYRSAGGRLTRVAVRRLVSQARPHLAALEYRVTPLNHAGPLTLVSTLDARGGYPDGIAQARETACGADGAAAWYALRTRQSRLDVAAAARHALRGAAPSWAAHTGDRVSGVAVTFEARRGATVRLEKVVSLHSCRHTGDPLAAARAETAAAPAFAALAREHAAAWAAYWRDADIRVGGDRVVQTQARFFVFHLLQSASHHNVRLGLSASIPAKSLAGPGYNGHVFWDTEIYMLPFFSQQFPEIAESLLRYRHDRLGAAAQNARASRAAGARFPWESADTGREECPKWLPRGDTTFRWRGGEQEIHINADVPLGYRQHVLATGREALLHGDALDVAVGTARYWASIVRESGGACHIRRVIGPDEYHSGVDDSVYTNALAAWNLRWADELLSRCRARAPAAFRRFQRAQHVTAAERRRWLDVAARLHIAFDPATGLYEQFAGYFRHPRQQIKQADVLLLLHLLPHLSSPAIFLANFNRYYPVTLHASSLSPALHVLFSLDCGRPEKAYPYLRQTCEIDGLYRPGGSDDGLHSASLGAGWTAIVAGFGGVRVTPGGLAVAPRLPAHWTSLAFSVLHRGLRLRLAITPRRLSISADRGGRAVRLQVAGQPRRIAPGATLRVAGNWRLPPPPPRPRPATPIRAVLFDLDGVVVSTDEFHYQSWQQLADAEGIPFNREINHRLRGVSRMESLEIVLERAARPCTEAEKVALATRKNDAYRALLRTLTPRDILPGVLLLLDALRARGIRTAIASSSRNAGTILEQIGLARAFDTVVDGNDIAHSKPHPEVFVTAARRLRVPPARCLVIEDATAGVEAAVAGGMRCLAVGAAAGDPRADLSAPDLLDADAGRLLEVTKPTPSRSRAS